MPKRTLQQLLPLGDEHRSNNGLSPIAYQGLHDDSQGCDKFQGQQIQHDKQIIAGQGQTSHQQSVDEHGGKIAGCHGDHQGDQQNPVNSTEEQQGSHNVGYNYDKNSTDIHHAKHELKVPNRDERLDRKVS